MCNSYKKARTLCEADFLKTCQYLVRHYVQRSKDLGLFYRITSEIARRLIPGILSGNRTKFSSKGHKYKVI